jgi:hypothetical protein
MKKFIVAATALSALVAAPAFAGGTHINVGFYSPAPVYYRPAPVVYYPPVQHVYYAPAPRYVYNNRHHGRSHGWGRPNYVAWNDRHDDRGWRGHH